jgi:hypothetical protein
VLPSAELATVTQFVMGAVVWAQLSPEFVESKIGPLAKPLTPLTATSLVPSADEATELNGYKGGPRWLQVFPAPVEV